MIEVLAKRLKEEEDEPEFSALPFHYMEIAHMLLERLVHPNHLLLASILTNSVHKAHPMISRTQSKFEDYSKT